jgi:hypothetical protein
VEEDILGVTSSDFVPPETSAPAAREKPLFYVDKEKTRPRVKSLALSPELTNKLRDRAREEGTTVQGALCAAFALAYWELNDELKEEPVRIVAPIDLRPWRRCWCQPALPKHHVLLSDLQGYAAKPPSSGKATPVMKEASGEQR